MPENVIDRKLPVKYAPELALEICELVASGKTLTEVGDMPHMPARGTIHRWLSVYPKFFDAMERAKEVSAWSFEEEALDMARLLKGANDFTGTKVQAYNIAMQQLRWSASRRDKTRYGQQAATGPTMVPIQINTTLNLGQPGQPPATDQQQSVYTVEVEVGTQPAEVTGYDMDSVDGIEQAGEVIDLTAEGDENEDRAFGLPETETQQLHNPPNGRPKATRRKRGHKSAAQTARTKTMLAKKAAKADTAPQE